MIKKIWVLFRVTHLEIRSSNQFSDALDLAILGIDLAMQISDANDRKTSSLCPIPAENVVPAAGNTPIHCVACFCSASTPLWTSISR